MCIRDRFSASPTRPSGTTSRSATRASAGSSRASGLRQIAQLWLGRVRSLRKFEAETAGSG
eukprot:7062619-Alexandrium_andersonii.AAC.1